MTRSYNHVPKQLLLLILAFFASVILLVDQARLLYKLPPLRANESPVAVLTKSTTLPGGEEVDPLDTSLPRGDSERTAEITSKTKPRLLVNNATFQNSTQLEIQDNATSPEEKITDAVTQNEMENSILEKHHNRGQLPWSLPPTPSNQTSSEHFMNELSAYKRSLNIPLPWETVPRSHLPYPIINLSLPKSATTTAQIFFKCGNLTSAHTAAPLTSTRIGDCMRDNFLNGKAPFDGCERNGKGQLVNVWTDIGVPDDECFYSSLHDGGLDNIAQFHPNATLLLIVRESGSWSKSIAKWSGGRLLRKWENTCGFNAEDWGDFYLAHTEKVRKFAKKHPWLTYVEVELGDPAAETMEFYTGILGSCFWNCHPGKHVYCEF